MDVRAPTTKETPERGPMENHIAGKTRTTKRAESLYSALRKEDAPNVIASYNSLSLAFCKAESLLVPEPSTEVTSSFTAATWPRSHTLKMMPITPVIRISRGAGRASPSSMPPWTQAASEVVVIGLV